MENNYDFGGWATRNDLKCSDGRTIKRGAFKHNDGKKVPLVWNHIHHSVDNVLGHAILEDREDGVYAYGYFNKTDAGKNAKELVHNKDVQSLSIWANELKQTSAKEVLHGDIKEVSLVLAGANPGALIDAVLCHGEELEDEGIIYTGENISIFHSAEEFEEKEDVSANEEKVEEPVEEPKSEESIEKPEESEEPLEENDEEGEAGEELQHADDGKTVKDVFNEFTEEQKKVVYAMIGMALKEKSNGGNEMKHNVFDGENMPQEAILSHSDVQSIFEKAKSKGSLKAACKEFIAENAEHLSHTVYDEDGNEVTYGIADINWLFPEYKNVTNKPDWYKREDAWVSTVMGGVHHTPFSRIKSMFADITMDEARAKGYVKGNIKEEEVFALLKRTTDPQTVYKKQKLDRDDILDITDFDVVAWLKGEMRMMLDEEIARAILIGDGRSSIATDKIKQDHIRAIALDDDFYAPKCAVVYEQGDDTPEKKAKRAIKTIIKSRKNYKGSGNPVFFTTEDLLTDMLLIEDSTGRVIYDTEEKLRTALRVSKIVTVPVMENATRTDASSNVWDILGIVVNLNDYNVGADKGAGVNLFDDFDIDYNQYKYLIETRCSGALTRPKSALIIEQAHTPSAD